MLQHAVDHIMDWASTDRSVRCALSASGHNWPRCLQGKLHYEAKTETAFRFYVLYDKICREDILRHAYGLGRAVLEEPVHVILASSGLATGVASRPSSR
jgi:hypothetical protein